MEIDTVRARDYINRNFSLNGALFRLCSAVFEYWNNYGNNCEGANINTYLTELLDPIGFNQNDVEAMIKSGVIKPL